MTKPLSLDLRRRVTAAIEAGMSCRAAAARFGIAASVAVKWRQLWRETGSVAPRAQGGDMRSGRIEACGATILAMVDDAPDITLAEIVARPEREPGERGRGHAEKRHEDVAFTEVLIGEHGHPAAAAQFADQATAVELAEGRPEPRPAGAVDQGFEARLAQPSHHQANGCLKMLGEQTNGKLGVHQMPGEQQHTLPSGLGIDEVLRTLDPGQTTQGPRLREPSAHGFEQADRKRTLMPAQPHRPCRRVVLREAQRQIDRSNLPAGSQQPPQRQRQPATQCEQSGLGQARDQGESGRDDRHRHDGDSRHAAHQRRRIARTTVDRQFPLDLGQRAPFPRIDLAVARNVLIYFDRATQRDVVARLTRSCVHGGYLALGYTERLDDADGADDDAEDEEERRHEEGRRRDADRLGAIDADGSIVAYEWSFGDGGTSSLGLPG